MASVVSVWSSLFWRYLPVLVTFPVWGMEKYAVRKKKVGSVGEEKKRSHHAAAEKRRILSSTADNKHTGELDMGCGH